MFLPPATILKSRIHVLHNLAEITSAHLDIAARISDLFADTTRASFDYVGQQSDRMRHSGFTAMDEKNNISEQIPLQFIDEMFKIASDTHKVFIKSTEAQIRVVDEIIFASIERASNFSPREIEGSFETINITLKGAEDTLHKVSSAAIHTVELSEHEFHEATQLLESQTSVRKTSKATAAKAKKAAEMAEAGCESSGSSA